MPMEIHDPYIHTVHSTHNFVCDEMFHSILFEKACDIYIVIVIWEKPKWPDVEREQQNTNKRTNSFVVERKHQQIINSLQMYLDAAHKNELACELKCDMVAIFPLYLY